MSPQPAKRSTLEFILTFAVLFFATNWALNYFFPQQQNTTPAVHLKMQAAKVTMGNDPIVIIENKTDKDLPLPARCPQPAVNIAFVEQTAEGEKPADLMANESATTCTNVESVKAGQSVTINLGGWKYSLFARNGTYEASVDLPEGFAPGNPENVVSARFSIVEIGFFTKVFRTFISKPLFNALIFIASWVPGHNLGVAIIVLTILIKLLLLVPNQHALEGQRKLQMLQPRMDEIKKKYPNDAAKVQEETMKLWKEMKINPMQSCLPTLLQLPILIGLFYVVRDGVSIETSRHLLYSYYADLPSQYLTYNFLGLDLLKPNIYVMPILLVVLQFIQMKMMMAKNKKKDVEIVVSPNGKKSWMPKLDQQTIMMYILPLMIGFFAIRFPAAVSLYWGISTLFGIAQQWYVLHEKLKV
jgi:YidC/Oxa1 family membrane protein insertase